jgi:demethylmenaquinone methyltransferase/2-methoxy-6-polyprenyl-1,4-benzoquinol methylase
MQRFDHFDLLAGLYDGLFGFLGAEHLSPLLDLAPGQRLLDVGGGTGRVSQALRARCTVVVCDTSQGMTRRARAKGLLTVRGAVEALPFADESFDRMLIVDAFHHFADHRTAAHELLRALRPGGRLVIEEPDIRRWPVKLIALAERLLLMRSRFFDTEALTRLFQEAGGVVEVVEPAGDGQPVSLHVVVSRPGP